MSARKALAIIAGAGPGTGASLARAFASKGYSVALLARSPDPLIRLQNEITSTHGDQSARAFPTDLSSANSLRDTFASIRSAFPDSPLRVAVYNVNTKWTVKPFLELQEEEYLGVVDAQIRGAFRFSKHVVQEMMDSKPEGEGIGQKGTLIFTGATAAMRGSAKFAALASASFAVRALSQSLARELQPQGIHVAHAVVDGVIDTERAQSIMGGGASAATGERLDPEEIAKAYVYITEQTPSAWTHELDLRPAKDKW